MRTGAITKKQQIMDTALEAFAQRGFENTTISHIAQVCGVSKTGLYEYFQNKQDLLFNIPEKHFTDLCESLEEHLLGVHDANHRVRKLIWHYLWFMDTRSQFARLFILEVWSDQRFYKSEKSLPLSRYWEKVKGILEEAIKQNDLQGNIDVLEYGCMIFGMINHMILSRVVFDKPLNLLERGPHLEKLLLGLMSPSSFVQDSIWGVMGKKGAILQAALEEFNKKGYAHTTISQISARAGITDPTLYEYFKSKEDILMAIPEMAVDKFLDNFERDMIEAPENNLRLFLWNQVASYEKYPDYYQCLIGELRCNPKFYQSKSYTVIKRYSEELTGIIRKGIQNGSFRTDISPPYILHLYFGMLDQLLIYSMVRPKELRISNKMERIYDLLIRIVKNT